MRIMIVSSTFPPSGWGGAEIAAEGVGLWLSAHGHHVAVYTDSRPQENPPPEASVIRRYVPKKPWWRHRADEHSRAGPGRKAVWHLLDHARNGGLSEFSKAAADFCPDLVMVHLVPGMGLGVFEHCAREDLPVLYVMHDFWLTCLRSSLFSRGGAACARRETLCRWSSSVKWKALSRIRRLGIWAPSRKVMELSKGHLGEVFENVLVERNIVDFADFRMDRPGADEPTVRFLYVGKVTVAKGVAFLLQCLASLPPHLSFEAHIVGNGDAEQSLREAYRTDGRIHFHGLCNRQEVVAHYQRASVLAVPSLWFEPAGLVIYQAQVAGLPVVASDSGGIPELLGGRSDSLVLAAGDAGSWTSRLRSLIEDPSLLRQMREAASRHASEYQGAIDSGANRVVDFCRSIMSSAPTSEVSRQ